MKEKRINNKKKPVAMWKKVVLFFMAQLILAVSVVVAYNVIFGGSITVETPYGYHTYHMSAFDKEETFEDTDLFDTMLRESLDSITNYFVVCNQMETNGAYDGKKIINISEYANRKNDDDDNGATALFYLEDLLKWSKYGKEYEFKKVIVDNYNNPEYSTTYEIDDVDGMVTVEISESDRANIEPGYAFPNQSVSSGDSFDDTGYYDPDVWMKQSIDFYTPYANIFDIYGDDEGNVFGNLELLKCRYKTIDGKRIDELVNNWQDYFALVQNLETAMNDLSINYETYQHHELQYGEGKTNIKFCALMTLDGEENYISNIPTFNGGKQDEENITEYFVNEKNKYLYYSPSKMEFLTNTGVEEENVFYLITNSFLGYAYPETTKLWIAVDTTYSFDDMFAQAHSQFLNATRLPMEYLWITAGLLIVYVLLMIILCCKAGWCKDEEGAISIKLNGFDRLHTEFVFIFGAILVVLLICMWVCAFELVNMLAYSGIDWARNIIVGIAVYVTGVIIGALLLSFVRRIKGHNLWSDTLFVWIIDSVKNKWAESVNANRNSMVRNWGIYIGYLGINFILLWFTFLFIFYSRADILGVLILLVAIAFDIWVGFGIMRNINERFHIINGINRIRDGEISYQVTEKMHGENQILADAVNNIGDGIRKAVETSMKDERMKADLITNVSHDIKTPLTSIINYVDLLKREDIQDEKVKGYIEVLESKSQRLKTLTEDLVEASKISSGNISYVYERINLAELTNQAIGEFSEKFESKGLSVVDNLAGQAAYVEADSRRMWRVIENLFNNIYKYALPGTRVYLTMLQETVGDKEYVSLSVKNISAQPLNIDASELTERFVRGDVSRSAEGSGLGLSIAKNLTEAQKGKFDIYLDGDLFKVTLTFPTIAE